MTTMTHTLQDSGTMFRRTVRRQLRYVSVLVLTLMMPIVFLLLFVYVFGGTLGDGLGDADGGRAAYLDFVTPTMALMAIASAAQGTAIAVAMDMTGGIIDRFRTMAISRVSVLTGHVLGSVLQMTVGAMALLGFGLLLGFRTTAGIGEWLAVVGAIVLIGFGMTWLTVAIGLASKGVESASNTPMFLLLLPFLSSGFVPAESMPTALRWFAEYQPFTPMIDLLRGLLTGGLIRGPAIATVAWSLGLALVGYVWARRAYERPRPA